jgi:hypothetical protein
VANAIQCHQAVHPPIENDQKNEQHYRDNDQIGKVWTQHLPITKGLDESYPD